MAYTGALPLAFRYAAQVATDALPQKSSRAARERVPR